MRERYTERQDLVLRNARLEEADTIAGVIQAAYAQYEASYTPEGWAIYFAMLANVSSHFGRAEVIVAERDGVIAGTAMFYQDGRASGQGEWPEGWAGILRLAVHPSFRGYGIGRALAEECVRRAREAGAATLALHTTEWMSVARDMYERRGFVRDESFDFYTRSGVHAMGYRLDLDLS